MPIAGSRQTEHPEDPHDLLAPATRLDEFEIIRVLGVGGFGIVYLALDHVLLRYVAIKEYMPTALAGRRRGATVHVRSAGLAQPFTMGLESFFSEARLLASFDHPSLVKVYRFWKANGTAYMAMQYYPGHTMKEARLGMTASPDGTWLRALVQPLLGALDVLHRADVYHRDISPDNILLLPDGRPVLLDFGSARRVLADRTQSLTAILKPNFAPIEQYADEADMRQGPWTDLYALGATVHFMLTGKAPAPAVIRAVSDTLPLLSSANGEAYPGWPVAFLVAIDWCLKLAPGDRPQSVDELRRALTGDETPLVLALCSETSFSSAVVDPDGEGEPTVRATKAAPPHTPSPAIAIETSLAGPEGAGSSYRKAVIAASVVIVLCLGAWALGSSPQEIPEPLLRSAIPSAATAPLTAHAASVPVVRQLPPSTDPVNPAREDEILSEHPAESPSAALTSPRRQGARIVRVDPKDATWRAGVPTSARALPPTPRERKTEAPLEIAKPGQRTPEEICHDRSFFSRAICISRECRIPSSWALPECVEARRADEQRQRRLDQQ